MGAIFYQEDVEGGLRKAKTAKSFDSWSTDRHYLRIGQNADSQEAPKTY